MTQFSTSFTLASPGIPRRGLAYHASLPAVAGSAAHSAKLRLNAFASALSVWMRNEQPVASKPLAAVDLGPAPLATDGKPNGRADGSGKSLCVVDKSRGDNNPNYLRCQVFVTRPLTVEIISGRLKMATLASRRQARAHQQGRRRRRYQRVMPHIGSVSKRQGREAAI